MRPFGIIFLLLLVLSSVGYADGETAPPTNPTPGSTDPTPTDDKSDDVVPDELKRGYDRLAADLTKAVDPATKPGSMSMRKVANDLDTLVDRIHRSQDGDKTKEQIRAELIAKLKGSLSAEGGEFLDGVTTQTPTEPKPDPNLGPEGFKGLTADEAKSKAKAALLGIEHAVKNGAMTKDEAAAKIEAISKGLLSVGVKDLPASVLPKSMTSFAKGAFAKNGICAT